LNAAAIAAAVPHPTSSRRSPRRSRKLRPTREAKAPPTWVYAASSPTEAPKPFDIRVCSTTIQPSVSDIRPPYSAFASIGSIARRGRKRAISSPTTPSSSPPSTGTAIARAGSSAAAPDSRSPGARSNSST
jgi:hypothetical protein